MTPEEWAGIVERDARVPVDRACYCDAASFWVAAQGCVVCGHGEDVHGADPARCAVRVDCTPSRAEADRRALIALVEEMREALADADRTIAITRRHLHDDHPRCAHTVLGILNDPARAALLASIPPKP